MVAHRKNVTTRKAYVPSGWFIVLTVMVCIGAAGWLGLLLVGDSDDASAAAPTPSSPSVSMSPDSTTPEPTDDSEPTDEPEPTDSPARRDVTVSVLNNSGVAGAARAFSVKVTSAGWPLGGVGNWTGSIPSNTVYYPAGLQEQAELLAADVGIERIRPAVTPMRTDRLTIILSGPQ